MIKDWTGGNSGFYSVNHRKKEIEVEEYDFYCTHPESIKLFLKAAKNTNLIIPNNILEPCCGIGSISKILKENGYSVYSSDLIDRGYGEETGIDFLKLINGIINLIVFLQILLTDMQLKLQKKQ